MTHQLERRKGFEATFHPVDPRLAGSMLVDAQVKQYASKHDFSALATAEKGYDAFPSNKGNKYATPEHICRLPNQTTKGGMNPGKIIIMKDLVQEHTGQGMVPGEVREELKDW
ncbi:VID27-domain-containing protein [Coniochaeta ligniaria NRRL 30616]|uniref:VID27-domain-containing protein n=1 Tax=Coniochaeta ligniaria NRRL 30616 TaxID=1408157 RepID=A0A1J7J387_9PEZI|nr:VID27-domain-containing protein [Coniochaeta ligniaria NRRL 30616]